jgi:hypothetical protein
MILDNLHILVSRSFKWNHYNANLKQNVKYLSSQDLENVNS